MTQNDLESHHLTHRHRLHARAFYMPYANREKALDGKPNLGDGFISLNGSIKPANNSCLTKLENPRRT